jgi:hypothetical protein
VLQSLSGPSAPPFLINFGPRGRVGGLPQVHGVARHFAAESDDTA